MKYWKSSLKKHLLEHQIMVSHTIDYCMLLNRNANTILQLLAKGLKAEDECHKKAKNLL